MQTQDLPSCSRKRVLNKRLHKHSITSWGDPGLLPIPGSPPFPLWAEDLWEAALAWQGAPKGPKGGGVERRAMLSVQNGSQ